LLLQAAAATVLRDGHLQQVPAAELVPGDIVELTGEVLQKSYQPNKSDMCNK
jgi:magnesium-transporting ATPase (P-type)